MNNDQRTIDAINTYLNVNRAFWMGFEPPKAQRGPQSILVDLLVGHPGYMIGNCVIAKYLQKKYNAKIIAMLPSKSMELQSYIAHSFDFDYYFFHDEEVNVKVNLNIAALQKAENIEEMRRIILDFNYNGVPLGDVIYDAYLRETGNGTIEQVNDDILRYMANGVRDFVYYDAICKQHNVIATVQGHIVYTRFGAMMRAAIHNGATVYGRKAASGPLTIRRYTNMDQRREYEFRLTTEEFEDIYASHKDLCIARGKDFVTRRFAGDSGPEYIDAFGEHKKSYEREELFSELGLDVNKPTVCVMSHIMPDAPHAFTWMLYNDYYEWLEATLEVAKDVTDVNWIVKEHPELRHYQPKHTATELTKRYMEKYPHIKLASEDLNTNSLFAVVDCVVTVAGTAALEFPTQGIPALVAGESAFSGFGFTIEPKSRTEYEAALRNIGSLPKLDQEQINRALAYVYMFFELTRVECSFMPKLTNTFWEDLDMAGIFHDATERLRKYKVEDDRVYNFLKIQLEEERTHLMNYDVLTEEPVQTSLGTLP